MSRAEALDAQLVDPSAPVVVDVYPEPGFLVDSLTPALRAWGQSNVGSAALSYSFKVCDVEAMSGTGCTASGYVAGNRNTWNVPAGKLAWAKQYWWTVTVKDPANALTTTSPKLTFTTGVRQPVVTSKLARAADAGKEFEPQSGNYTTVATDLSVATVGPPLSVVRTFNSLDPRTDGIFGAGWSTRWDMKIVREVRGGSVSALVTGPDGSQARFKADGSGAFQPPPGMFATLVEEPGGTWRMMDKSSTVYLFDAQGRLTKVTDQRSRSQDLAYGSDGKLATVTGVGGRSLTFTWAGAHVASVASAAVDGQPLVWTYGYDGNRLTSVCAPVAAPNCTAYEYGNGSQYRSTVLNSDPYGYWRLGEASGTTAAGQGTSAGNATYQSVTLAQPGALVGTSDTAVAFTSGATLKLPANAIPHLADQASVEMWFKTGQSGVLLAAGSAQTSGIARGAMLYVGTDGKLRGSLDTVMSPITSAGTVNDNAWHHVVLTVSGQDQTLFLDGQQVGTMTGQVSAWRQYASVGNGIADPAKSPAVPATAQAFPFQGAIDEVALYDKPLTAAEVQGHYAARAETLHKLTKVTRPSGRVAAVNTYDERTDRLATHTDNNGGLWKIGTVGIEPQSGEAQVVVTDPNNEKLTYLYDAWRGYRKRGETDQLNYTTWYEYDQGGFLTKIIDRNDIAVDIYQDKRGNTIGRKYCRAPGECAIEFWSYHLNPDNPFDPRNDQVIAHRDGRSAGESDNTFAAITEYNTFGEQTKQTTAATQDFPAGRSTTIAYTSGDEPAVGGGMTPAGLVETRTDARGNIWAYRYSAAGDLAEQSTPEGLVTKLDYDVLGRPVARTQVSDAQPDGVKTVYTFDGVGRVLTQTEAGVKNEISGVTHTARTTSVYDPDGLQLSQTVSDLTGGDPARVTTTTYNGHGRPESTTDPEGGITRQTWNNFGTPASSTDQRGARVEFGHSKRNELITTTLKGWTGSPVSPQPAADVVLESTTYDSGGRLVARVDAMGRKTTQTYWGDNRPFKTIADDAKLNGSTTPRDVVLESVEYDPAGNAVQKITGGGLTTVDFVYDAASRLTSQTVDPAALSRKSAFAYDAAGNVIKSTLTAAGSSRSEVKEFVYNSANQVTRETIDNGDRDVITVVGYDDRGLTTAITDPRGNEPGATAADYTTTLRYDALGRLVEAKAPTVNVDKAGASTAARPSSLLGYNSAGDQSHARDAEGRVTTSTFDKMSRPTMVTSPSYTPPGGTAIVPSVRTKYDLAGQLIEAVDARGWTTKLEYDRLGRPVRTTNPAPEGQTPGQRIAEYDLVGEVLAAVDPLGARVESTYDDLGRRITSTQIERKPTSAAYTTKLEYNDAGQLTKQVAPGNKSTVFTVNAAGEVTVKTDPLTHKTTLAYDLAGRLTKTTDALGNATQVDYDLAGRKVAATDLNAAGTVVRTTATGYDAAGNPISATSPEGHLTKQSFDALNRPISLIEPTTGSDTITTSFGYDAAGARTRLTDGRGNATWTTYNSLGLPETVTEPATTAHPNLADRTWTSIYDTGGKPVATIQPGGVRIDRTFDHLGRMTKQAGTGAGIATADRIFGYDLAGRATTLGSLNVDYNDRGLPLKISDGTVQQSAYAYDALGNPTQRIDAAGTANFTWDNANRPATVTDPVTGRTLTYGYDNADRLTSLTPTTGQAGTQTFTYDAVDRLDTHTLKSGTTQLSKITYGWDKDDNLTSKTTAGTAGAGANSYAYDKAGRLTSWTAPGGAVTGYEWDASGNRTKAGDKTFTYDERNRLTSGDGTDYTYTPRGTLATETKGGTTRSNAFNAFDELAADGDASYTYDALGRMTSRAKAGAQQLYRYSGLGNDIAAITDGAGATQATYSRDATGDLLGLKEGAGAAVSALSDLHDDLVATFNGTSLVDSTAYDPFGAVTVQSGSKRSLGYQGEYTDPDSGKVNMAARWYQPGTGAFASRDSATLAPNPSIQANRYTYANATPLTTTDPTGHWGERGNSGSPNWSTGSSGQYGSFRTGGGASQSTGYGYDYGTRTAENLNTGYTGPVTYLSDEEVERLGYKYMPNGRPSPKGFWEASEVSKELYMATYSPALSEARLKSRWDLIRTLFEGPPRAGSTDAAEGLLLKKANPDREREWCKKNWDICVSAYRQTERIYAFIEKKFGPKETDQKNAVRHFVWQVSLTRSYGAGTAKELGDAHEGNETCRKNKKRCDTAADRYNNSYARAWTLRNEKKLNQIGAEILEQGGDDGDHANKWLEALSSIGEELYAKGELRSKALKKQPSCQGAEKRDIPKC